MKPLSIYVHIPFCKSKCSYCDFASFVPSGDSVFLYVEKLLYEIENAENIFAHALFNKRDYYINTVFIGGGTPTSIGINYLENIINALKRQFNIDSKCEFTIEANPETVSYDNLTILKNLGINRISLGVQSFNDMILGEIGRIHNSNTALKAFDIARKAGFNNINIDLMFSLPYQTISDIEYSLKQAFLIAPEHISYYGLILEEGTALNDKYIKGSLTLPDDKTDRQYYHYICDTLADNGYHQYEISNFSKPGFQSRHNKAYWILDDYIGFGLSAHSFINNVRMGHTSVMNDYLSNCSFEEILNVTQNDSISEFMFLGLRMTDGISIADFKKRFQKDIFDVFGREIKNHINNNLLELKNGRMFLTPTGIDISNYVFQSFI